MDTTEGMGIAQGVKTPTQEKVHTFIVIKLTKMYADLSCDDSNWLKNLHFFNDLNFDGIDFVEFALLVEREFGISIPDHALNKIFYLHDFMETVVKLVDEKQ